MTQVDRLPTVPAPSPTQPDRAPANPRVLRVMTRLHVGAPARRALFLTQQLPRRGFDSRLVWGASAPGEASLDPPARLPATSLLHLKPGWSPSSDLRSLRAIEGLIARWRPRIVHTHLAKAGAIGRLAASRRRVPVLVHTFHGHVLDAFAGPLATRALIEMETRLAARTDALVAETPEDRDDLLALGIGRYDQWHVVAEGVELDHLTGPQPDPAAARAALGLPADGPIVGWVGGLVPIKDHEVLLQAGARLLRERPDVTFVLSGDGELRERFRARAAELMGDRCVFLGWIDDLPELYAAMDVMALTSRLEGLPVSLIEAAAAGKPVVVTRYGAVREVVRDGETGLLVAPNDPVALAASLHTLLDDPEGARRMGQEGADWVAGRFSAARQADQLADLYRELLDRAKARAARP